MCEQQEPGIVTRRDEMEYLERMATECDAGAFRFARGRPALDVALGEIWARPSAAASRCFTPHEGGLSRTVSTPPCRWRRRSGKKTQDDVRRRPMVHGA